jgi:protein phosphatase
VLAVYYTSRGPTREENEDAILIDKRVFIDTPKPQSFVFENRGVIMVADGVGGYRGGAMAASILAGSLSDLPLNLKEDEVRSAVISACEEAAKKMRAKAEVDFGLCNMSSAAAGVYVGESYIVAFNCGDCRVYRLIKPYLNKVSHDHSAVQMLFDQGLIEEDEMRSHPRKNVITSSIGAGDNVNEIFFKRISLIPPLKLFLCSDGVWEALSKEKLEEILSEPTYLSAPNLTNELYKAQATDNISFVILEM